MAFKIPKRKYAWKPDVPDHRDHYFSLHTAAAALPDHVDPLGISNRIEDQGSLGSCTGNSSTSALEITLKLPKQLSRLMAYYEGRAIEGTIDQDSGAMIRDVIKGFVNNGVCNETLFPYTIKNFAKPPSEKALAQAKTLIPKIASYQRVSSLLEIKTALSAGLPVIFGFSVPEYFEGPDVANTGWVKMPTLKDKMIGGHAVVAVGYDDRTANNQVPFIWVRNSWGNTWGAAPPNEVGNGRGYFKMDQNWFTDKRRLVDDMWIIHPK